MIEHSANRPRRWREVMWIAVLGAVASSGCQKVAEAPPAPRKPQQAGQPMDPLATAGHIAGARLASATGDSRAAQRHIEAISHDFLRSARIADAGRPIDPERARSVVSPLDGVRSAVWMDRANLIVMVDGARYRSAAMIDQICLALEPLGDTLAVVVNLQDVSAKTPDGATTLSRNCQLPEGQRALLQAKRPIDVVSPELRAAFKAQQTHR